MGGDSNPNDRAILEIYQRNIYLFMIEPLFDHLGYADDAKPRVWIFIRKFCYHFFEEWYAAVL